MILQLFGSGDYAMRVWLDPNKVAAKGLTASEVVAAIREQNVQVAAGGVGQQPVSRATDTELLINTKGRLSSEEEFGAIIVKRGANGERVVVVKDGARYDRAVPRGGTFVFQLGLFAHAGALANVHARDYKGSARLFRANIIQPGTNDLVDGFDIDVRGKVSLGEMGKLPTDGLPADLKETVTGMKELFGRAGKTILPFFEGIPTEADALKQWGTDLAADPAKLQEIMGKMAGLGPSMQAFDGEMKEKQAAAKLVFEKYGIKTPGE